MTPRRKCTALALAAACLVGAGPARSDDHPAAYAVRIPVGPGPGSPVQRLAIPAEALVASRSANLADLRVFDATDRPMPIARIAPAGPPLRRTILPVLPILGAADVLDVTGMSLRPDGDGRARVAQIMGTFAAPKAPPAAWSSISMCRKRSR